MAANNILKEKFPHYHRFVDNQVLTDDELNRVLDHINFQDKITRTGLIGVGILCGFNLKATDTAITLEKGIGVTTDGDVLYKEEEVFSGFSEFKDENVLYEHFLNDGETIKLYELETDTSPTNVFKLNTFSGKTGIAKNEMVALLYLESFFKEEEDCAVNTCNAQGLQVINNLRVLVTSAANARLIAIKDSIFAGFLNAEGGDIINYLPELFSKKVLLQAGNTGGLSQFKQAYTISFQAMSIHIENLGGLSVFNEQYSAVSFNIDQKLKSLIATDYNFQYIYDFYRDLVTAYNELVSCLRKNYALCCPDFNAFPKHLLLGEVYNTPVYLRHQFYASPIHDYHGTLQRIKKVFARILRMIENFNPQKMNEVEITPSRNGYHKMGERALPFYYDLEKIGNPEEILKSWNLGDKQRVWNYFKKNYPSAQFDPLDYNLEDHDFLRIEGHVAQEVNSVIKSIETKRREKGLNFQVVPVAIGDLADESTIDYTKYKAQFEDLQIVLQAWNEEQKCMMKGSSTFLSRFSTAKKGAHLDYLALADLENTVDNNDNFIVANSISRATNYAPLFYDLKKETKTNTILDSIDSSEESTGKLYGNILKYSDNDSDIILKITGVLENVTRDWEEELKIATVKIPSDLLGKLKLTEDNKLTNISDFTEENLKKYIDALDTQCKTAKLAKSKLQRQLQKEGSALRDKNYIENYFYTLNRIISACCLGEKFSVLYKEVLKRKKQILEKFILKNYIKSHPGAEHRAGVPVGGTFIVLYYSSLKESNRDFRKMFPLRMFAAEETGAIPGFSLARESARNTLEGRFLEETIDPRRLVNLSGNFPAFVTPELFEIPGLRGTRSVLAHGTVIGDLCLPYLCCSDTPALNYIMPELPVSLFIGREFICKAEREQLDEIKMDVSPANAEVKAFIGGNEVSSLVSFNQNNWFFNPNNVTAAQFGQSVSFTVNGQNVPETTRVVQKPEPSFKISSSVEFNEAGTTATIILENTSKQISGQTFVWDFGEAGSEANNSIKFNHTYKVKPGETFNFNISLTANNGPCTNTASQQLTITVPKEEGTSCRDTARALIENSFNLLMTYAEKNESNLNEENKFFREIGIPFYKNILNDLENVLNQNQDAQIFAEIVKIQTGVSERLNPRLSEIQQAFLLSIYFEMVQVYFHIQKCRDNPITARREVSGTWLQFTRKSRATFPQGYQQMNEFNPLGDNLTSIIKEPENRISAPVIEMLKTMLQFIQGQ